MMKVDYTSIQNQCRIVHISWRVRHFFVNTSHLDLLQKGGNVSMSEISKRQIMGKPESQPYQVLKHSQDITSIIRQTIVTHRPQITAFALVIITFHFSHIDTSTCVNSVSGERSTQYLLQAIRKKVRQSDLVWRQGTTCYFLLLDANLDGGNIVQERLWQALHDYMAQLSDGTITLPSAMTIGHSAYPQPATTLEQCLHTASIVQLQFESAPQEETIPPSTNSSPTEPELSAVARQLGVPYLSFLPRTIPARLRRCIRPELMQELQCFPLGCHNQTLTVAMINPSDRTMLDRLKQETGMHIFPVLIHPDELENTLEMMGLLG